MFGIPIKRALEIEQIASDVWRKSSAGRVPVSSRDAIFANGIILHHMSAQSVFDAEFDMEKPHPPYFLSLRDRRGDENKNGFRRRMRFTEAHELGHFFLHYDVRMVHRENYKTVMDAVAVGNFRLGEIEIEANAFAGALLMPREVFENDLEPSQIQAGQSWMFTLAQKYDVSLAAVKTRIARLREGLFLSGYAWANTGVIMSMIPSLDLELADPEIAKKAWRCNPQVQNHVVKQIPRILWREFQSQVRELPENDIATAKVQKKSCLIETLPDVKGDISGDVFICGCNEDGKKIYFEIELACVNEE
jgi:hypothetical protein